MPVVCICGAQDGTFARRIRETTEPDLFYIIDPMENEMVAVYDEIGEMVGTYKREVLRTLLERFHPEFRPIPYAEFLNSIDDGHLDTLYITFQSTPRVYISILEMAIHKVKHRGMIHISCNEDMGDMIENWCNSRELSIEHLGCCQYSIKNIKRSIHLVSLSNREILYGKTFSNHKKYAELHDIKCTQFTSVFEETRHPAWQKVYALLKVMETAKEDYIIWLDDDVLFTNPDETFYSFIDTYGFRSSEMNCMLCEDIDTRTTLFNTGVFIFKNNDKSKEILESIWNLGDAMPMTLHGYSWEQEVFNFYYKFAYPIQMRIIPHGTMQSMIRYGSKEIIQKSWKLGDFIIHISASTEERLQYIELLCKMLPKGLLGVS